MIEQALFRLLSTNSDVAALVSMRIYPSVAPPNAGRPFVVYQQITEQDISKNLDGQGNLLAPAFQIDAYAETYAAARQVAHAIKAAVGVARGTVDLAGSPTVSVRIADVRLERTTDFYESDVQPKLHRVSRDYRIIYEE
jgi:hypothetical protein